MNIFGGYWKQFSALIKKSFQIFRFLCKLLNFLKSVLFCESYGR